MPVKAYWLNENFNLTQESATNFMKCAERFGKMKNVFQFQPSQLMAMLALPAEETEKFIAEKAAEGTLVLLGFSVYFLAKISKKS